MVVPLTKLEKKQIWVGGGGQEEHLALNMLRGAHLNGNLK